MARSNDSQCPTRLRHFIFPNQVKEMTNFYSSFQSLKSFQPLLAKTAYLIHEAG